MAKSAVRRSDSYPTPQLPLQVHRLWPELASQVSIGGARLKDVLRVLDACATGALVCAGNLDPVKVSQEPAVSSPQPEDDDLLSSGQACDVVIFCIDAQAVLPLGVESAPLRDQCCR